MSNMFAMWAMMQGDQDPDPRPTCPFCGDELDCGRPGWLAYCERCDLEWRNRAAIEHDARAIEQRRQHKAGKR